MACFTLKFVILYYYPPPRTSANRAGFVATDKFNAPLFLYFSVLQGSRFKMTGAYTKSAFAGVVIIVIFMLKYTTYEILLEHEYDNFGEKFLEFFLWKWGSFEPRF